MAVEVILPKVDMDMETGQISRWYAKDGDMVTKGQLLFEIETDKAAMEVEAPASGVIADISAAEGAVVPVGQAVAWIYEEGEERSGKPAAVAQEPIAAAPVDRAIETATPKQHDPKSSQDDERDSADKVRATPLARRLARDAGIDLATVQGSGPKGRVQKKDVEGDIGVANLAIPAKSFASKMPNRPHSASSMQSGCVRGSRASAGGSAPWLCSRSQFLARIVCRRIAGPSDPGA